MLTIIAMAAVATVVYATVATAVRWIENPVRTTAQRASSWVVLVLVLAGIAAVIINADKDVVVGFCIGALIAPVLNNLVDRRTDRPSRR
jgi:4-hydroxybenzoate polyprenyltransferase